MNERANLMNPEYLAALAARVRNAAEAATPGPWDVWAEKCPDPVDAKIELAEQVDKCEQFVGELYLLNAAGKCPATTGCGPTSKANATFIAAANPQAVLSLLDERDALTARVAALEAENEKLRGALEPFAGFVFAPLIPDEAKFALVECVTSGPYADLVPTVTAGNLRRAAAARGKE